MSEKASFRPLSSSAHLLWAILLLFALLGSGSAAAAPYVQLQASQLEAPGTRGPVPPGMPVCHRAPDHVVYLPLVMRGAQGGALRISAPAATMTIPLGVVIIYDVDISMAQSFGDLLGGRGFNTYYVPLVNVPDVDLTACDLVIVGSDTGSWTGEAARNAVLDAGLPVAVIGEGGLNFLSSAGLLEGLATGSGNDRTVEATLRGREAYLFPKAIPLAGDDSVELYTTAVDASWLELPAPLPEGIEVGRLPGTTRVPIMQLQKRFLLWGFGAGPGRMTQAGQDLFVNCLVFQSREVTVPLRTRRFIPEAGVEQAFLDDLGGTAAVGLHAFIQLRIPPGDDACDDLANLVPKGVTELYRLHGRTHVAFIAKSFDPNDGLVADCLRWVGRILPQDRAHPTVLADAYPEWADNGDGTVNLLARFMPDVAPASAEGLLDGLGAAHKVFADEMWAVVLAKTGVAALTQQDILRWLRPGPQPALITNDDARHDLFVDEVQDATISGGSITYNGLDGTGVTVGVFDDGVDDTHPDFSGRMLNTGRVRDHGTHVAGIIGASGGLSASAGGAEFRWRGMAPGVEFAVYNDYWTPSTMAEALNTYDIDISNNSLKMNCCDYDGYAENADELVRGDFSFSGSELMPHLAVWAAGNHSRGAQYCRQIPGDPTSGPRGFYSVTAPAKNVLSVGSVIATADYLLTSHSSRGPTWDGRLKPDVMGMGYQVVSTVPDAFIDDYGRDCDGAGDDWCYPYDSMSGTSMASPSVAGVTALAIEQYHETYGARPAPEGLKALLINTATDLVHDPADPGYTDFVWDCPDMGQPVIFFQGPDFSTGYGVVHARRAVKAVEHKDLITADLSDGADVDEYTFDVLADRQELRFTLVWSDPAGDPSLDVTEEQLVNDLDLVLEDPNGGLHYPWVLDPLPAAADHTDGSPDPISQSDIEPAYRAVDYRNNVEQVVVWADDVDPGDWAGTWTARVRATGVDGSTMPQPYALVGEWREITLQDIYPLVAGYNLAPDEVIIPVRVHNPQLALGAAAGGISAVNWEVRIGDSASSTWTGATVEAAYGPVSDLAYLVVRPPDTLAAGILYDIEVTLLDVYQVDQRVAEAYEPIDRATRTDAIFFLGEARAPVDEIILMDNSGSMGDYGKLDSAKNAARAFADRRQVDDMIGLTRFANLAITLYDLTMVSAAETELEDIKIQIDNMTHLDNTAIGSGMLEAKNQLDARGNPTHTWGIVLLSDGNENIPPCWDTDPGNPKCEGQISVQPDFVPVGGGCPTIHVDTVAIGPDFAVWRNTLQDIAEKTCGDAWNATVEGGTGAAATARATWAEGDLPAGSRVTPLIFPESLPNTLADIYISIADGNSHQQRLWEEAGTLSTGEMIRRTIRLESGLPEATFAVNWPNEAFPFGVKLFRPTGVLVDPADPDAHHKADATHEVYRMEAPDKGDWTLEIGWKFGEEGNEYLAVVSSHSDVTMLLELGLLPPERVVGAVIPIYVVLVDEGGPITGANVQLAIRRPNGGIDSLIMHDDSSHGDAAADDGVYTNEYIIPDVGNFQVKGRAEGTAHDGEPFLRYRLRHFRVSRELRAAYVVSKDIDTANAYKTLLDGNGLVVTLVDLADVEMTDLNPFDLVIIGPDTGEEATWGDVAKVAHIRDSGKPVLGLGDGGYAFFGKLGLNIGYNHGTSMTDADVVAVDKAHDIWDQPYDVVLGSPDPVVTVYARSGSPGVVVYLPGTPPDVEKLGQRPAASELYWLAREQGRYLLWGFNLGPAAMTDTGKEVFVNTAYYAFP